MVKKKKANDIYYFDGKPSIVLKGRPILSIVIPSFNGKETIGDLLESILKQKMDEYIEVIIVDDCSTESSQDVINKYRDLLSIKQLKTNYNGGPGNARELGVSIAEGVWLTFADDDDVFVEGAIPASMNLINEQNEQLYAIANFLEVDAESNEVIRELVGTRNWCHAKFYNMDNLWKPFNIHFAKDLFTHEDICISSQINCILAMMNVQPLYINLFAYVWKDRPNTITRRLYDGEQSFIEKYLGDYIESTAGVYLDRYINTDLDPVWALGENIGTILYCYFYMQAIKFKNPNYNKDNNELCRSLLIKVKKIFKINNSFIYNYVSNDNALLYYQIKESAAVTVGRYIEQDTFWDWLNFLHEDIDYGYPLPANDVTPLIPFPDASVIPVEGSVDDEPDEMIDIDNGIDEDYGDIDEDDIDNDNENQDMKEDE
jgi:glycosyltransferase involved in cell wall biosynthesis